MKKYTMIVPIFALLFVFLASEASAYNHHGRRSRGIEVESTNHADVLNEIEADSDTGDNWMRTGKRSSARLNTGNANANAYVDNQANSNETEVNRSRRTSVEVESHNTAIVTNYVEADSDTGDNGLVQDGYRGHRRSRPSTGSAVLNTGNANSGAEAFNLLNSNFTRVN